jgi:2-octaprenyl-6-methoxyphenol hydroxylase
LKGICAIAMLASMKSFEAVVVGAGPAGLAAACLLARGGMTTALVTGSRHSMPDPRTVALMLPSIRLLDELGVWPAALRGLAAPLRKLRLVDDTGSPFPAPALIFSAEEIGKAEFGWNTPLAALLATLTEKAQALDVHICAGQAEKMILAPTSARVTLHDGEAIAGRVILAADGRESIIRRSAGISASEWTYDQTALALSFAHSAPHRDISSEYHKQAGPFTTVPLPGRRSSLVWMERPARAEALLALDDRALAAEIQVASHGELGRIGDLGPRGAFPIRGLKSTTLARNRVMLIGEAGHVVPPVGAQGLNMSLRDAAWAAELIISAVRGAADPGGADLLTAYDAQRRADILSRQSVIDLMNRSLISHLLPLEGLRALSLAALKSFAPLRRYVIERGAGLSGDVPVAMR